MRTFKPGHVPKDATREELVAFAQQAVPKDESKDFALGMLDGLNSTLKQLGYAPAQLAEIYP